MSDIAYLPARALARQIVAGKVSATEALNAVLARTDRFNEQVNAIVTQDRDAALARAKEADAATARGVSWGPLHGVPMSIKEAYEVAGMRSTGGSPHLKDHVPDRDAVAVARLRAAGAVIFGKSNVPVFSGDFQSFNPLFGTSRNPWNLERTPGGSSGGAAAALAAGMTVAELGSDIGGSIRTPAHFCGVFGHKPTTGIIPTRGHIPPPPGTLHAVDHLSVSGPLARTAEDLRLLLEIAGGEAAKALPQPRALSPRGLRVALWVDDPYAPNSKAVSAAIRKAARALADAGAAIDEEARPGFPFDNAFEIYSLMMHAVVQAGLPPKVRDKVAQLAEGAEENDKSHQVFQGKAAKLLYADWLRLQNKRAVQQEAWRDFFTRFDVVLCPASVSVAVPIDEQPDFNARTITVEGKSYPYFDLMKWSTHATLGQLPGTVAPTGETEDGLPIGVQIVGPAREDMTTIAVAAMLERELGGFTPPPGYA